MGDEHSWRQIMDIISGYRQPVVIVSATARTTRQLVAAAGHAPDDMDKAEEIVQAIQERHLGLVENFLDHNADDEPKAAAAMDDARAWIGERMDQLRAQLRAAAGRPQLSPRELDAVASTGEQLSAYLFARCGEAFGLPARWVDARDIIRTDSSFGQAVPDRSQIDARAGQLRTLSSKGFIPVMGGYYGQDQQGAITTLGFEGSDYSASLVGAALGAEAIEIWTDVSGIYTCDPRVVREARPIPELSFQEATELAYFGAKILHPSTMKPAAAGGIPVYVKNIFEPGHPGTKIHDHREQAGWAKALTYLKDVVIVTVTADGHREGHAFLAGIFEALDQARLPVNAVTTTEASVSVALSRDERLQELRKTLQAYGTVDVHPEQGLISLIGCTFGAISSLQQQVWNSIESVNPTLISYSKSKQNLNIAVPETELIPAVCAIHDRLFGPAGETSGAD